MVNLFWNLCNQIFLFYRKMICFLFLFLLLENLTCQDEYYKICTRNIDSMEKSLKISSMREIIEDTFKFRLYIFILIKWRNFKLRFYLIFMVLSAKHTIFLILIKENVICSFNFVHSYALLMNYIWSFIYKECSVYACSHFTRRKC
jgi:hypothetical protein